MFKALLLNKNENQIVSGKIQQVDNSNLPEGDVVVKIDYSTLNYKDALAITSSSPVIKNYPMIPGIDFSGTVEETENEKFKIGDKVVLNGFGVGEKYWGGISQKACVSGDWLIKLPEQFTSKEAMAIGTAGYTAMLCIMALEKNNITPDKGEIIVTGSTGGVGSIAISILNNLGYEVCASTGRPEYSDYLKELGAKRIIGRNELSDKNRPLQKAIWSGAIDSVGSHTLANICASTKYNGTVAACGLAQGYDLPATVMPFILRGVNLAGIDSVYCPIEKRIEAWKRLTESLDIKHLNKMTKVISLSQSLEAAKDMLEGKSFGRIVIDVNS